MRLTEADLLTRVAALAEADLYGERALLVHDLDALRAGLDALHTAFPPATLHAVAVKANPVVEVLKVVVEAGHGLETASFEELMVGRAAGCPPERLVYDSPARTHAELRAALDLGVVINVDSVGELERIEAMGPQGRIGLRVNPEVGAGQIAATSTGARGSRFGVSFDEAEAAFRRYPWLTGLHIHVGSQGIALGQLLQAAERVDDLRQRVGASWVDIGGGLPVAYRDDDHPPPVTEWAAGLRNRTGLFEVPLITELGRWVQSGCGFALSRVEHVKGNLAVIHLGADLLLRRAYRPDDWWHEVLVLDADGQPKEGAREPWTVVGPLCFSGDVLVRDHPLPSIEPGDLVAIRDTGAYTLGMWSRHCSRGMPAVLGWQDGRFQTLLEAERPEDVVALWSRGAELRADDVAPSLPR